jgi:DNA-binding IclR family transcriptional regulator
MGAYSSAMSNKRAASYDADGAGNGAGNGAGGVQSVDRAITLLEILARRGEAGVSEVAAEIDVHKSTAFRLLGALESRGLVQQSVDRGKYRLGFGLVRLAGAVSGQLDVTHQGRPVYERLAHELGETVNVAVLRQHYAVNVDQVHGASAVTVHDWVGNLTPLHVTSSGRVLLAALDEPRRTALIEAAGLDRFTPNTVTSKSEFAKILDEVREQGYSIVVEEYEVGLNAMAAPILGPGGQVLAAVSVSGPAFRFTPDVMQAAVPVLLRYAAEVSQRLGYLG